MAKGANKGHAGVDAEHRVAHGHENEAPLWGVSAEFDDADTLLDAVRSLAPRALGRLDTYSPVPLPAVADALGIQHPPMNVVAILGALAGGAAMMAMCLYATAYDYVFNIGGRPLYSWPAFVVPTVSFATLTGAFAVYVGLLALNRLPTLNHPSFNIPNFSRSTQDRYFLVIESRGDGFDPDGVEGALAGLAARPRLVSRVKR